MSDYRKMMSAEERAELDELLFEATHDVSGNQRPTAEFGYELQSLLSDADRAARPWAEWVIDSANLRGFTAICKGFLKQKTFIHTSFGDRIVTKSAFIGVKRNDTSGDPFDQQVLWEDLSRDDLQHVVRLAAKHATAARDRIAIGRLLLELLDQTGLDSVSAALAMTHKTLDEFLIGDAA